MNASGQEAPSDHAPARREMLFVLAVALLALVRVALLCLAVPLFTNLDEEAHLDTVHKYARGYGPRAPRELFDERVADWVAMYGSPEFTAPPQAAGAGQSLVPPWKLPPEVREPFLQGQRDTWGRAASYESHSPPVYYVIAAAWMRAGEIIGIENAGLIYWLRALNAPLLAAAVLLAWVALRRAGMPTPVRVGVPMLLACMPQDVFYSINADALSPLVCVAGFTLILGWLRAESPSWRLTVFAGLVSSLAVLTKLSNYPVLLALLIAAALRIRRRDEKNVESVVPVIVALTLAAVPIVAWCARNAALLGDITGTADKVANSDWTKLPISAWFSHPIFRPRGMAYFVAECLRTLWRGEIVWYSRRIGAGVFDVAYVGASLVLLVIAVGRLARDRAIASSQRISFLIFAVCVAAAPLVLVWTSIAWDFGTCVYPSRQSPYLTSGRLMLGSLVPLLALITWGLEHVCPARLRSMLPMAVITIACGAMLIAGVTAVQPMFGSAFNWFHLP